MQDRRTGLMNELKPEEHDQLKRIFAAGGVTAPLFALGDVVEVNGGNFRVLAIDRRLLVLEGVAAPEAAQQRLLDRVTASAFDASRRREES